jgi:hypothetical protein
LISPVEATIAAFGNEVVIRIDHQKRGEFSAVRQVRLGLAPTIMSRRRLVTLRMVNDLGGSETLSAGQQQLVKRCAMISVACELMEKEAISGQPLHAIAYGTLTGHLTRTLNALGLKREPIDVTPALHEYLDTLQPAEPQDFVAAADESEG